LLKWKKNMSKNITLAGGCFWCLEAVFQQVDGVEKVVSGYCGGDVDHPTYQMVCSGNTGHAEAVQITFEEEVISEKIILDLFFAFHDPTSLNRQGADVGTQYRSAVFYETDQQRDLALDTIDRVSREQWWTGDIVTEVTQLSQFFIAENYHQNYFLTNLYQPYCQIVITPKMQKLLKEYSHLLKNSPSE
tara:strand:+ start:6569 stop:7135 length:567 start_codon:yes stop_codon:yes gene_type:complete